MILHLRGNRQMCDAGDEVDDTADGVGSVACILEDTVVHQYSNLPLGKSGGRRKDSSLWHSSRQLRNSEQPLKVPSKGLKYWTKDFCGEKVFKC